MLYGSWMIHEGRQLVGNGEMPDIARIGGDAEIA